MWGDLVRAIDETFQRILRWVYPGGLVLTLLYIGNKAGNVCYLNNFINFNNLSIVQLIVVFIIGAFIYLFQAGVFNLIPSFITVKLNWNINAAGGSQTVKWLRSFAGHFDKWAISATKRWSGNDPKGTPRIDNYLNYAWSIYHSIAITSYITLIFFICLHLWWYIFLSAAFFCGAVVYFAFLSRIPNKTINIDY